MLGLSWPAQCLLPDSAMATTAGVSRYLSTHTPYPFQHVAGSLCPVYDVYSGLLSHRSPPVCAITEALGLRGISCEAAPYN